MISKVRLRKYLFAFSACLVSPISLADAESFDSAVNEYLKGFRACIDANNLRSSNIVAANKKFMYYKQQLDLAVSINEGILDSTERDMDRNLDYCQRVEDNLKRAEATPILEHAFTYCEASRSSYEKAQYTQARTEFEEYRRYKEDAFAITPSIEEVFVLASKVRSCERYENKLVRKEQETEKHLAQLKSMVTLYQTFKLECESTQAFVQREDFKISELNRANRMLNSANKSKKAARAMIDAQAFAEQNPQLDETIQLRSLEESARICEGAVTEGIRKITKQRRALKSFITVKNGNLEESLEYCEDAQDAANFENLEEATISYQQSASLKKKATSSRTVNLIKNYPYWKEAKAYNELLKQTKDCQDLASSTIKSLQKEQAESALREQEEREIESPLLDNTSTENSPDSLERASNDEPSEQEFIAGGDREPSPDLATTSATSNEAIDDPANWEDVEENTIADTPTMDPNLNSNRKSWTDLVR
ncbi:MAG: hypothetical protein MI867_22585 [Pseudomonadales bacterium]|nr:hypothetical protein [Pseudomonadales bacterium]